MKKYILPLLILAVAGWIYFEEFILPSMPRWEGEAVGREIGEIVKAQMASRPQNNSNPPLEHATPLVPRVSFSGKAGNPVSSSVAAPPPPSN